jgi:hypothetical protein
MGDRERRGDEGVSRKDDLVPAADSNRPQQQRERRGPGRDADAVRNLAPLRELGLESLHLLAENEAAAPQQPLEDLVQLVFEHAVLPFQRTERDRGAGRGI